MSSSSFSIGGPLGVPACLDELTKLLATAIGGPRRRGPAGGESRGASLRPGGAPGHIRRPHRRHHDSWPATPAPPRPDALHHAGGSLPLPLPPPRTSHPLAPPIHFTHWGCHFTQHSVPRIAATSRTSAPSCHVTGELSLLCSSSPPPWGRVAPRSCCCFAQLCLAISWSGCCGGRVWPPDFHAPPRPPGTVPRARPACRSVCCRAWVACGAFGLLALR
ncbi:hypothetical protein JOD67_006490 [Tenggerimyces flavus]|nr:hypothetical protein [Tenggerimyces flavus]